MVNKSKFFLKSIPRQISIEFPGRITLAYQNNRDNLEFHCHRAMRLTKTWHLGWKKCEDMVTHLESSVCPRMVTYPFIQASKPLQSPQYISYLPSQRPQSQHTKFIHKKSCTYPPSPQLYAPYLSARLNVVVNFLKIALQPQEPVSVTCVQFYIVGSTSEKTNHRHGIAKSMQKNM